MAFEMKKGNAMHRNFPGAFKDVARDGETKQHPEHHQSRGDVKQGEKEIFDPNQAGINRREQKRGYSGTTLSGGHGSSGKNENSEFVEPTRTAADEGGGGSFDNVNVLPEAEVVAPTRKESRKEQKDQFKAALEAWRQGGKEGKRPKRRDYK
tara:strand:+ start:39 stop:494 length:456 start_codon:yes stop_codon:yes gene_type:complete